MAVHVGTSVITEITENSHNVLEVSGNIVGADVPVSSAHRSSGDMLPSTTAKVTHNYVTNYNHDTGDGYVTDRFTAPRDGHYWFYTWYMIDSEAVAENKNYRIIINDVTSSTYTAIIYGGNGGARYKQFPGCFLRYLNEGDYVAIISYNIRLYGTEHNYTRFQVKFVG